MTEKRPSTQSLSRDAWLTVTTMLVAEFEAARDSWFGNAAEFSGLLPGSDDAADNPDGFPGHDSGNAMRGYQLFVALTLISTNQYVDGAVFEDFADILCAQVCGADYFACMEYYNRFAENDDPETWIRILGEVIAPADGASGMKGGMPGRNGDLREMIPLLGTMTMLVTARSFGDSERAEEYAAMLGSYIGPPEGES